MQILIESPACERRRKPRLDPRIEHPTRLVSVIPGKALELARLRELHACGAKTGHRTVLDERLRSLGHHGHASIRPARSRGDRHPSADTVSERDDPVDA